MKTFTRKGYFYKEFAPGTDLFALPCKVLFSNDTFEISQVWIASGYNTAKCVFFLDKKINNCLHVCGTFPTKHDAFLAMERIEKAV